MSTPKLDTHLYWEQRLRSRANLQGTGHRAFSEQYNQVLYQAQVECLDVLLHEAKIAVNRCSVLDVGSGVGYFVRHFLNRDAHSVIGSDLTFASVQHLQTLFPDSEVFQCDVSAPNLPLQATFDIISCISVLYHILDDVRFTQALTNLCQWVSPEGVLIVSDIFRTVPAARHARFRSLATYETILARNQMQIVARVPVYFLLNRTFLPIIGPWLIDTFQVGKSLAHFDRRLRQAGMTIGASMYFLLAKRVRSSV
jgi:2-polyprenyl-3-methyl-5-hydroxy-6-metoxy-1,4-benzoquinol methylase